MKLEYYSAIIKKYIDIHNSLNGSPGNYTELKKIQTFIYCIIPFLIKFFEMTKL